MNIGSCFFNDVMLVFIEANQRDSFMSKKVVAQCIVPRMWLVDHTLIHMCVNLLRTICWTVLLFENKAIISAIVSEWRQICG